RFDCKRKQLCRFEIRRNEFCRQFAERFNVLTRNKQRMSRKQRTMIEKRYCVIVFVNYSRRQFTRHNSTKQTIVSHKTEFSTKIRTQSVFICGRSCRRIQDGQRPALPENCFRCAVASTRAAKSNSQSIQSAPTTI